MNWCVCFFLLLSILFGGQSCLTGPRSYSESSPCLPGQGEANSAIVVHLRKLVPGVEPTATMHDFAQMTTVQFSGPDVRAADISCIRFFPRADILDISGTKIDDPPPEALQYLPDLFMLNLSETNITDKTINSLPREITINRLFIPGTRVTDASIPRLIEMRPIGLNACNTRISKEGAKELARELGSFVCLNF